MRAKRLRPEQTLLNKVTNTKYIVTDVTGVGEEKVAIAIPEAAIPTPVDLASVTISKENSIAFMLLEDPNPVDVPEAMIQENELIVDGVTVSTGEIEPLRVIGCTRGYVYLIGQLRDKKCIFFYDVYSDRFTREVNGVEPNEIVLKISTPDYLICKRTRTDEQGRTISSVVHINNREVSEYEQYPNLIGNITSINENILQIDVAGEDVKVTDADGNVSYKIEQIEGCRTILVELDEFTFTTINTKEKADILNVPFLNQYIHNLVRIEDGKMSYPSKSGYAAIPLTPALKDAVLRHPILVDVTEIDRERTVRLSFSSASYEIITLQAIYTRDRGVIVTLE